MVAPEESRDKTLVRGLAPGSLLTVFAVEWHDDIAKQTFRHKSLHLAPGCWLLTTLQARIGEPTGARLRLAAFSLLVFSIPATPSKHRRSTPSLSRRIEGHDARTGLLEAIVAKAVTGGSVATVNVAASGRAAATSSPRRFFGHKQLDNVRAVRDRTSAFDGVVAHHGPDVELTISIRSRCEPSYDDRTAAEEASALGFGERMF